MTIQELLDAIWALGPTSETHALFDKCGQSLRSEFDRLKRLKLATLERELVATIEQRQKLVSIGS
jgi:hypothetical protein